MSNAIAGVGAQFKREVSSGVFTAVAEVKSITGPGMTRDFIDVTNLDSTGGYREYIAGFRDGGELTFSMNFTLDGYDDLLADFNSNTSHNYQVVLPDTGNTTFDFAGYVTALPLNIVPDDAITVDVTIKITGQVTMTS
jgi:predicted secreted protein